MAFCTHCGAPLPEQGKFCPNCGTSIEVDTSAEIPAAAGAADPLPPAAPPVPVPQQLPDAEAESAKARKKPRRAVGTLCALASFALAMVAFFGDPPALSIVFAAAAIVAGVFAFIKKGRLKAFAIIAFLVAVFSLAASVWTVARGDTMFAPPKDKIPFDQMQKVTEGGIIFELPTCFEKHNGNGFSTYTYGSDFCVVFASQEADAAIINMFKVSDLKDVIETTITGTLENCTNINGSEMTIVSCDSWVSEDSGSYNGEKCYAKTAGIKNTAGSSVVICSVLYSADEKEQGQKLFDTMISSAVLSGTTNKSIGNTNASASGSTAKTAASASGVDPDLAAFLSSYESFIDEYVAFMENYLDDPSNVISMLGDYLEMTEKLEDFSEQADRYDPDDMSAADSKYYLEVMARCEMKLLDAMG